MNEYTPPVSGLLTLGRPEYLRTGIDYRALGFNAPHVPQLIRLLQDEELAFGDSETPEVYAQTHAWRVLGQLRAPEAIGPLLDLLERQAGSMLPCGSSVHARCKPWHDFSSGLSFQVQLLRFAISAPASLITL